MKTGKTATGAQALYFKPGEIDKMCESELRKAKLLPEQPGPIDIELFVESHLGCRVDYADVPEGVLGYTLFSKGGKPEIVGISPSLDDGTPTGTRRMRSTFAHEAGHCILHPILFMEDSSPSLLGQNLDFQQRRILCRENDMKSTKPQYNGRWWEYQANCAIGGFLLPKRLVAMATEPFTTPAGLLGIAVLAADKRQAAAREISGIFDVSLAAAEIRLSQVFPAESQEFTL